MSKPTLKWDLYKGKGSIGNQVRFRLMDPLLRLDLLRDWIYALEAEYELTHKEFHAKLTALDSRANRP
jgi:hypothetical protein